MQYIECRVGEGLVIGDQVVVHIESILEDDVLFKVEAEKVVAGPPVKSDACCCGTPMENSEKNAA